MMVEVPLTEGERERLQVVIQRIRKIRECLCQKRPVDDDPGSWFMYLSALKAIQGNADNDLSFLACILAKRHLVEVHGELSFDAAHKPQGAPGLDIDLRAADGRRIVGEVKTTTPHKPRDFGGQQWTTVRADIEKLRRSEAECKYLFVTDDRTHEILTRRCSVELVGINLVRLQP
jgi:hypothetical protein